MIKKTKLTYRGMNRDITKSKHPFEFYYEAENLRIITSDSQTTASGYNEKGNELIVTLPTLCIDVDARVINYGGKTLPYNNEEIESQINDIPDPECGGGTLPTCSGTQQIIGYGLSRDSIILFSTDSQGFDCIWEVEEIFDNNYEITLLYCRNLGFSVDNPIQSIFNYENSIIQKIYWVDGKNQLRFLNIRHSIENGDIENLIDVNSTNLNVTGEYSLFQPEIVQVTQGGNHTAGMIQYAYNLYKLNGSQTTISPLSELTALDFGATSGGGEVNEIVGAAPLVEIRDIDTRYTHIKIYAIKYTSFNQTPSVSVIVDQEIDNYNVLRYFDDGTNISTISLAEFLFLGSNPFIPQHIQTKDNRMFAANILDRPFLFEIDGRAYSHDNAGNASVWNNVTVNPDTLVPVGTELAVNTTTYIVPDNHDSINLQYGTQQYQSDGVTLGGEGRYLKYEIVQKTEDQLEGSIKYNKFFKDNEIYRIGIQFYNTLGQKSFPIWIADFRTPEGNLEGNYNTLNVELKPEFYDYIDSLCLAEDERPVGYKILRADRQANDRTILCQGSMTSMMCQTTRDVTNFNFWKIEENRREESKQVAKIPIIMSRDRIFQGVVSPMDHLFHMNENPALGDDDQEVFRESASGFKRQQTWQFNKMMQLYSPEILFNTGLSFGADLKIRLRGIAEKARINEWVTGLDVRSLGQYYNQKHIDRTIFSRGDGLSQYGWIGPARDGEDDATVLMNFKHLYHDCSETFTPSVTPVDFDIYGIPEITERGQGGTNYNNDPEFRYTNRLDTFLTDRKKWTGRSKKDEAAITTINSWGGRCITLVQGTPTQSIEARQSLEQLWDATGVGANRGLLIGEIAYPDYYAYVGNIYGGNSYEAKTRTSYIEIGEYVDSDITSVQIDSPGDTFVQIFQMNRIGKTDTQVISPSAYQLTDVIRHRVETTINLLNRQDLSLEEWDAKVQPNDAESHKYNRVYSQQANLIQNQSVSFKFKKVNSFDTRVIASKSKIPGETIDSFSDFLENEIIDLDGKYGAINAIVNFRDELYTLQDQGVAHLIINPRVQVQGTDGLSLELGRGSVLYDYQYASTTSGTINKWSVFNSPTGFYYLDALNKSWNRFTGGQVLGLSDQHGFHHFFENNVDYTALKADNPLIKQGVSGGYDFINNNAYITFHQGENEGWTLNFNEGANAFESFHSYKPSIYINKGHKMYTTSPNLNQLWEHDEGVYNEFYGETSPTTVTFMVNPEADLDCVFNNIEYKSEVYLDDLDQPERTLTHISAWNEYQQTNRIPLTVPSNIKRKFRNWRAQIPRQAGSRDRIRNPWIFLKLEFENPDNAKLVLHDIIVHYTV